MAQDYGLAISAVLMLLFALVGGFSPSCAAYRLNLRFVSLCDALSAGVLLGVATCHMLSDGMSGVDDDWGKWITRTFGKGCGSSESSDQLNSVAAAAEEECDPFPAGLALFVLGMFLMIVVNNAFPHDHHHDSRNEDREVELLGQHTGPSPGPHLRRGEGRTVLGVAAPCEGLGILLAVSFHSIVEGMAVGASQDATLGFIVLLHKFFAAFAVGDAILPQPPVCRYIGVVFFALTGPAGVLLGLLLSTGLEGVWSDALTCFAGGTLLSIALCDMLLPKLHANPRWTLELLFACFIGTVAMMIFAIWA